MRLKRKNIIRFLSTISLLIFFLPFFQTCSDKTIREESGFIKSYGNAKTEKEKEIAFQKAKEDFSASGYELALTFESVLLGFTAIMVLNFTIWVCALRGHRKLLFLSFLNLVFILFSFIILVFALPGLGQIRYGMYACVINALLVFYFIYKDQKTAYNKELCLKTN